MGIIMYRRFQLDFSILKNRTLLTFVLGMGFSLSITVVTRSSDPHVAPSPRPLQFSTYLTSRGYTEVPLEYEAASGWCYLNVSMRSKGMQFLIDTGASQTYIDPAVLKVPSKLPRTTEFLSPSELNSWQYDINVGDQLLRSVSFRALDCRSFLNHSLEESKNRAGIIGCDFLDRYKMIVDYQSVRAFLNISDSQDQKTGRSINLLSEVIKEQKFIEGRIVKGSTTAFWYLKVNIAGKPMNFLLDSGSQMNLVFPDAAKRLGYSLGTSLGKIPGVAGRQFQHYQRVALNIQFSLAKPNNNDVATIPFWICDPILDVDICRKDGVLHCDGVLGSQFLMSFSTVFDFVHEKIYINQHNLTQFDSSLNGDWSLVSLDEGNGNRADTASLSFRMSIRDNVLRIFDGKNWCEYKILTFPWKQTRWIDLIQLDPVDVIQGIYQIDNKKMTLVLAINNLPMTPGRPASFKADKNKNYFLFELSK
jgi:predicted aspartyl protease